MTPERYQLIGDLFDAALDMPVSERQAFLDKACGADAALRSEVENMLATSTEANDFLAHPAMEIAAKMFAQNQSAATLGQQISQYQIQEWLGAGGMGDVYLAYDTRLNRKVALKLLPTQFTQDAERVQRLEQEAHAISALNHPNIITIYDIGHTSDDAGRQHFIATELIEGQTLRQLLQHGPLALAQVLDIALQLTDALSVAHRAGILHRDLKPENIMLRPDEYVKVLDFGLAKLSAKDEGGGMKDESEKETSLHPSSLNPHPYTTPDLVMGTVSYMSPEQARGQELDARTDIFSLGIVLYELLSGVQPFARENDSATYKAILHHTPPSLRELQSHLPADLAGIIARLLEKDRALRFQTMDELRTALQPLLHQSVTAASPARTSFRYRTVFFVVSIMLCVLGAGYLWRTKSPRATAPNAPASFAQQTDQPDIENFPTLSPDGQTMVYASQESGNWDLWQMTMGSHARVNLTRDYVGDDTQSSFSPDGHQLAFRSDRDGGGLFVMDLSTHTVRKVCNEGFNPSWSPDGSELAYGLIGITQIEARLPSQLWAVRIASGEKRALTTRDGVQPTWSPHGQYIAYATNSNQGKSDLMTVPAQGGDPIIVTNDVPVDWNPVWSPDGQYLYFTSNRSGNSNLWRIAMDETTGQPLGPPEPFTTPALSVQHISLSRDGHHLAYVQRTNKRNLRSLSFDPTREVILGSPTVITRGTNAATHPHLSPDGQWLAFLSIVGGQSDIYLIHPDGTGLRQLTNDTAKENVPRWSPDGKRIVFFSDRTKNFEIWSVIVDGVEAGKLTQITFLNGGRAVFPTWSPAGDTLAFCDLDQGSFLLNMRLPWASQTPLPLAASSPSRAGLRVWDWSPDGSKLACVQYHPGSKKTPIVTYALATGTTEVFTADGDMPIWLSDSQRLLSIYAGQIMLTNTRTKKSHSIFNPGPNEIAEYCTLSHDNRRIYYAHSVIDSDIWLMTY